jgi:hypothetical protein
MWITSTRPTTVTSRSTKCTLALKLAGRPITVKEAEPVTWWVWMRKK